MKKLSILCAVALLLIGLGSCQDEQKELIGIDIVEEYDVGFEIKDGEVTATTYSYQVIPSDKETPYVCLYVDKSVIDKVPKHDLPEFLVAELHKHAESQNKPWADYLASISHRGDTQKTLEGLLPGNMYELVVFGVRGEQLARSASYRFFETLKADNVGMTFEVEVTTNPDRPTSASVGIKPSIADYKWYFCSFPSSSYDQLRASGMSDRQMAYAYLQEELRQRLGPSPSQEDIQRFVDTRFHVGERTLGVSGPSIKADTEYTYLLTAIYITPANEVVFTSETTVGQFRTPAVKPTGTTFTLAVDDITQTTAALSVSPSDPGQKYVWRYGAYNEAIKSMSPQEHAKYIIDTNPYIMWEARAHGDLNQFKAKLVPGTEHFLIAFGYEGGVCTEVYRQDFRPAPAGDPRTTTFEVETVRTTTDRIQLRIRPSDASVYYMPLLYPDAEDKESIKGRIIADMRRLRAQNVRSGYNPHATLWDMIAQSALLGEHTPEWDGLPPGGSCTLLVLTFAPEGIAAEHKYTPGFLSVPGYSAVEVNSPEVLGIFDGDEEQGEVFKNPYGVQGKAIMVLRYRLGEGVSEGYATVGADLDNIDELDTQAFPDAEIIKNRNLNWTKLRNTKPYLYLLTDWDKAQMSFSYGLNAAGERGPIARIPIAGASKSRKGSIDDLKRLVEAETDTEPRTSATLSIHSAFSWLKAGAQTKAISSYMPLSSREAYSGELARSYSPDRAAVAESSRGHRSPALVQVAP